MIADAAKIRARKLAAIAHQVHGAIGFTHEHGRTVCPGSSRRATSSATKAWWSRELGKPVMAAGADAWWPAITTG